jgi:hypothetical protein
MKLTATELAVRVGISASLAVSGAIHAYLYIDSYRHIPAIGPSFLLQASISCALAVLILVGGPGWLRVAAAGLAVGALGAFALSRTIGLFGFTELGWEPTPYAAVSVIAEIVTVVLCAAWLVGVRRPLATSPSQF